MSFPNLWGVPIRRTTGAGVNNLSFGSNSVLRGTVRLSLCLRVFASVHINASTEYSCSVFVELHVFIEPSSIRNMDTAASRAECCWRDTRRMLKAVQR